MLEPLVKMVDEIVEVFSTMVGVTSGILGLKNSPRYSSHRKKKRKTPPKSRMRMFLVGNPLVKTVHDGGSSKLVDAKDGAAWLRPARSNETDD
jgi:hypothetical protein